MIIGEVVISVYLNTFGYGGNHAATYPKGIPLKSKTFKKD